MTKLRVGVIFGGKSAEHEVSLQSAKNIVDAIDKEKFDVTLLGIDKQGQWHINDASNYLLNAENPALIALNRSNKNVALIPGQEKQQLIEAGSAGALGQPRQLLRAQAIDDRRRPAERPHLVAGLQGALQQERDPAQRRDHRLAGLGLPLRRHGVLEVDAHEVRAARQRRGQVREDQPPDKQGGAAALRGGASATLFSRASGSTGLVKYSSAPASGPSTTSVVRTICSSTPPR